MTLQISGTNGQIARVTSQGRIETRASTQSIASSAARDGDAFFIPSGDVTVPSASGEETILFIQNDRDAPFIIDDIRVSSDGQGVFALYINVTADNAAGSGSAVNSNAGSNKAFDGVVRVGDGSNTAGPSGGSQFAQAVFGSQGGIEDIMTLSSLILEQGNSVTISFDSQANADAGATVIGHYAVETN